MIKDEGEKPYPSSYTFSRKGRREIIKRIPPYPPLP